MLHESGEDYLEAILVIRRLRGSCRNVDIAERLARSKPSVTKALSNLAAAGFVRMSGRDVLLTEEGERAASATLERHRFFERRRRRRGREDRLGGGLPHGALPLGGLVPQARRAPGPGDRRRIG